MKMNRNLSKALSVLSCGMLAASVFLIVDGNNPLGLVLLASGECFLYLSGITRMKETRREEDAEA